MSKGICIARSNPKIYSDNMGMMVPKYMTSSHPSDIYDETTLYEWNESNCAYMNDAEDIVFYDTVSAYEDEGYFHFGREAGDE